LTRTDFGKYRKKITDTLHKVLSTIYVYCLSP